MANIPENLDYSSKDFDAMLDRLQKTIQSVFPQWTDFNRGNFGNILLESFSFVLDYVLFYQDNQARETRWSQAQLRKNLIALAKLVNFEPNTAAAASTDLSVTVTRVAGAPASPTTVTFLEGQQVLTQEVTDPLTFQFAAPLTITIPTTSDTATGTVTVKNSVTQVDTFISNGLPNQSFKLSNAGVLEGTFECSAGNGTFTEVESFLNSTATSKHFTIVVNENEQATAVFGDGTQGVIPTGSITFTYETGGGVLGNVEANTITRITGTFQDSIGSAVTVSVNNSNSASGGANRETNASIRKRAPESLRVLNRAIAREDFEIVAKDVAGVARALMLTSDEDASIQENVGELVIVPSGGGVPSTALKTSILEQFEGTNAAYPKPLTFDLSVVDAQYLTVNVRALVFFETGQDPATVAALIRQNLASFFAITASDGTENTNIGFGFKFKSQVNTAIGELAKSDIYNVVRDTTGVKKMGDLESDFLLNGVSRDVTIAFREFPVLGTVTIVDGATGTSY